MSEKNEEAVAPEATDTEGTEQEETVSLSKQEYEKLNQTLGSLKRELKDLKKPKEEPKETVKNQPDESVLLQKLERISLRTAGITHADDIELARNTAKKWGMDIDEVLVDEDFKAKLEKQQTNRDNATATTNIRGGQGTSQAKNSIEYWEAKGVPPTPADIPDSKVRQKIISQLMKNSSTTGTRFYNQ